MKIIISPAKKMNINTDVFPVESMPVFLERTKILMKKIQSMDIQQLKKMWKTSDKLTLENYERYASMDLESCLTPAILSYEGLQYQHMAPVVFSEDALTYIRNNLRILSGFYGIVKPFDGVVPYRLEMQAKLQVNESKDLYAFWGDFLYRDLCQEEEASQEDKKQGDKKQEEVIVNLASKEYSKAIEKYAAASKTRFITIEFGEFIQGKIKQKGTVAKMARGEMVRYMAENQIKDVERMKEFCELGFAFEEGLSTEEKYVFVL